MWHKYINGNCVIRINDADGTKIRATPDDEFRPAFAENIDIKISDCCDIGCPFCHEGCSRDGGNADFRDKFWHTFHAYQEVALGGGNIFANPLLDDCLRLLRNQDVFVNITVHQDHFRRFFPKIKKYHEEGRIHGIGISINDAITPSDIEEIKHFPTAVLHAINGILTPSILEKIQNRNLKLLILGYKELRRGKDYLSSASKNNSVRDLQRWLGANIKSVVEAGMFDVVSFDNLAIEQLDVKSFLTPDEWDSFYMGDDGGFTFYIDAVNKKFAKSSTAPLDKRYRCMDSLDDMFNFIHSV